MPKASSLAANRLCAYKMEYVPCGFALVAYLNIKACTNEDWKRRLTSNWNEANHCLVLIVIKCNAYVFAVRRRRGVRNNLAPGLFQCFDHNALHALCVCGREGFVARVIFIRNDLTFIRVMFYWFCIFNGG